MFTRICNCFEAGALVHTERGAKAVDQIVVGDRVLARDELTGETAYKPVTALIAGAERTIWDVTVETVDAEGEARRETIGTTDEHPWGLVGGDWAMTAELEPGAELVSADGHRAVVISALASERVERTYNFEVEDFHTYFVGEAGLWVHNACGPGSERLARSIARQIGRDLGKDARRAFHDMKVPGAGDRTAAQLYDDALNLYREYGLNPPGWFR